MTAVTILEQKRCPRCGQDKCLDAFSLDASRRDGRMNRCKDCDNAANQAYQVRQRKRCPKCGECKPRSAFYRNSSTRDGLQGWCKDCALVAVRKCWDKNRQVYNERYWPRKPFAECEHCTAPIRSNARWCEDCVSRARTLEPYGMTIAEYEDLVKAQGGGCAICGRTPKDALVVDHCHETSIVRGLLCRACNTSLGVLGDNEAGLRRALAYLTQISQPQAGATP